MASNQTKLGSKSRVHRMPLKILLLSLVLIATVAEAQIKSSSIVVLDKIDAFETKDAYEDFYYSQLLFSRYWPKNGYSYEPILNDDGLFPVYRKEKLSGKINVIDTFLQINKAKNIVTNPRFLSMLPEEGLKISNCYVNLSDLRKMISSDTAVTPTNLRTPRNWGKVIVPFNLNLSNCIAALNCRIDHIDSLIFLKKFSSYSTSFRRFFLTKVIFNDTCLISLRKNIEYFTQPQEFVGIDPQAIFFQNAEFREVFVLENDSEGHSNFGINAEYYNPLHFQRLSFREGSISPLSHIKFENAHFRKEFIIHSSSLKDVIFKNVTFAEPLFLSFKRLDSVVFEQCIFTKMLDLRNTAIGHTSLRGNFFNSDCNLVIDLDDDIAQTGLDLIALQKVFFMIDWGWKYPDLQYIYWDHESLSFKRKILEHSFTVRDPLISPLETFNEQHLELIKLKFSSLRDYVSRTFSGGDLFSSDKQKILVRLNYQEKQYEKLYYQRTSFFQYVWLRFLEMTVNFGYHGEWTFVKFCLWLVFGFAIIYRIFFTAHINAFINGEPVKKTADYSDVAPDKEKAKAYRRSILRFLDINFIKCLYTSFIVFFNPKFPAAIFKYSFRFTYLIMVEWTLGLLFIVLFLYFIAGNYPIVTKLIGL